MDDTKITNALSLLGAAALGLIVGAGIVHIFELLFF